MSQPALWTPDESESLGKVWGLDPGTATLALGIYDGTRFVTHSIGLPRAADPSRRLAAGLPVAQEFLERMAVDHRPTLAAIEQPAAHGRNVHPSTWYVTAMTIMAVANAVDCPIHLVTPPVWKASGMGPGYGHADKAVIRNWARQKGWRGASEHEADSAGIASCAYKRLAAYVRNQEFPGG